MRLIIINLVIFFAINSYAQSFDCEKASAQTEKLICASERLSALDKELSIRYEELMAKAAPQDKKIVRFEQLNWLEKRNGLDEEQLISLYQKQIDYYKKMNINYLPPVEVLYERLLKNPQNLKGEKMELSPLYEPIKLIQTLVRYHDRGGLYQQNIYKARYNGEEMDVVSDTFSFFNESLKLIETIIKHKDDGIADQDNIYKARLYGEEFILRLRSQGTFEFAYANFLIKQHDVERMLGLSRGVYIIYSPTHVSYLEEDFEDWPLNMLYTSENSPFCRMYVDERNSISNRLTGTEHPATLIDSNGESHSYDIICDGGTAHYCRSIGGKLGIRLSNDAFMFKYAGDIYVRHGNVDNTMLSVFRINPDNGAAEKACHTELDTEKSGYYDTEEKYPEICGKVIEGDYTEYKLKTADELLTQEQAALFGGFREEEQFVATDYDNDGKEDIFNLTDCASGAGAGYAFNDIQLLNFDNGSIDVLLLKENKDGLEYIKGVAREPGPDRCYDGAGYTMYKYMLPVLSSRKIIKIGDMNYLLLFYNYGYKYSNGKDLTWVVPDRLDMLVTKDNVTTAENICKFRQKRVYK